MSREPDTADIAHLYRSLRRIRRTEEVIAEIYPSDKIKSPIHLSIGQEPVAVGVCDALGPADIVAPTYRCHAAYLAKGGPMAQMMAELFGKAGGCAGGKGGSMHLVDMTHNILGASAVVGTNIPIAVGFAMAQRNLETGNVVAVFLGDGATEEGTFSESLNFAALHRLPILFVCENNGYAIHTPISKRWAVADLAPRVEAFGIPFRRFESSELFALRAATAEAVAGMRAGSSGPVFFECRTYRWREHVGPNEDYDAGYRDHADLEAAQAEDPLAALAGRLAPADRDAIDAELEAEIAAAVAFAEASPEPVPEAGAAGVYAA